MNLSTGKAISLLSVVEAAEAIGQHVGGCNSEVVDALGNSFELDLREIAIGLR